jgi:hypothetical protein
MDILSRPLYSPSWSVGGNRSGPLLTHRHHLHDTRLVPLILTQSTQQCRSPPPVSRCGGCPFSIGALGVNRDRCPPVPQTRAAERPTTTDSVTHVYSAARDSAKCTQSAHASRPDGPGRRRGDDNRPEARPRVEGRNFGDWNPMRADGGAGPRVEVGQPHLTDTGGRADSYEGS